jgi:hypothetical protein
MYMDSIKGLNAAIRDDFFHEFTVGCLEIAFSIWTVAEKLPCQI